VKEKGKEIKRFQGCIRKGDQSERVIESVIWEEKKKTTVGGKREGFNNNHLRGRIITLGR